MNDERRTTRLALPPAYIGIAVGALVACTTPNPLHRDASSVDAPGVPNVPNVPNDPVVGPVCTANQALQCDGTNLVRCNSDGTGQINQPCSTGCNTAQKLCRAEYKDANILWRHDDGRVAVWLMDHTIPGGGHAGGGDELPQDIAWTIRGTGDFDGDGHNDILFQNKSSQTMIWLMNEAIKIRETAGTDPGIGWTIAGVGDFDADGGDDVLWSKGRKLGIAFQGTSWSEVSTPVDPGWDVQATGDFNGDAHSDVLFRHTDGRVAIWFMNGTLPIRANSPGGTGPGPAWSIQGVADFDADSRDDILWRSNTAPYPLAFWFAGEQPADGASETLGDWKVQFVGDFNHDKNADILWRGPDGKLAIWFLAGTSFIRDLVSDRGTLPPANSGWHIHGLL